MSSRRGFTLVEVLLAVIILVVIATSTARFATDFTRSVSTSSVRVVASGAAADRLELIRADPRYDRLTTLYGTGAGADTTGFSGFPQMRRVTRVVRDTSGSSPRRDRTTITVRVSSPGLKDTVAVTAVIASP